MHNQTINHRHHRYHNLERSWSQADNHTNRGEGDRYQFHHRYHHCHNLEHRGSQADNHTDSHCYILERRGSQADNHMDRGEGDRYQFHHRNAVFVNTCRWSGYKSPNNIAS